MDYYLEHPPLQPKVEIADYVESEGILVPQRFASVESAQQSGKPIFVRSEHPGEYADFSGLLRSFDLTKTDQLVKRVLKGDDLLWENELQRYCDVLGIPVKDVSYSLWEKLPGVNLGIVADSSIAHKYHIMTEGSNANGYWIVEKGQAKLIDGPAETRVNPLLAVDLYERIRTFSRFEENNCPLMELQQVDDQLYFLQYHHGRVFCAPEFKLDRNPQDDEIVADFVRGHTPKEGISGQLKIVSLTIPTKPFFGWCNIHTPGGAKNTLTFRNAKIAVVPRGKEEWLYDIGCSHQRRDCMFVPDVSVIARSLFRPWLKKAKPGHEHTEEVLVEASLVADGNKAYMQIHW